MPYRSYVLVRFVVRFGLFGYFKPEWSGLIVVFVALSVFYVVCKLADNNTLELPPFALLALRHEVWKLSDVVWNIVDVIVAIRLITVILSDFRKK